MKIEVERAGVNIRECQAKIFGGGYMFSHQKEADSNQIGRKNGEMARKQLHAFNIPVIAESLFGRGHRRIVFNISNGEVHASHIKPDHSDANVQQTIEAFDKIFKGNFFEINKLLKP
jgi:chemotaxis protein CheD